MNNANALVQHPSIAESFHLDKGTTLTFIVEQYHPGCFIERYDAGVYVEGLRAGTLHILDAVTFRCWKYSGKDPRDLTKDFENEGSLPLPRDAETFYRRFGTALEKQAQKELGG